MRLKEIYRILHESFGYQNWWPIVEEGKAVYRESFRACRRSSEEAFEIAVGAILTQNTSWNHVVKAISALKESGWFFDLSAFPLEDLSAVIRPAGYFNQKARKLRELDHFIKRECRGNLLNLKNLPLSELRQKLLALWGIGPETADSILLYALGFPVFVVDAYTRRIFTRFGFLDSSWSYDKIQELFVSDLNEDAEFYGEFHALLVRLGKDFCRKKPSCSSCPLKRGCEFYKNF